MGASKKANRMADDRRASALSISGWLNELRDLAFTRDWANHTRQSNKERIDRIADGIEEALRSCPRNAAELREALEYVLPVDASEEAAMARKQSQTHSSKHVCQCCGEELVPKPMVMLLLSVYGQYRALYHTSGGLVRRKEFEDWLREVGPMDDEQLCRIFGFLRDCGFLSVSMDGEYLIYGKGLKAEGEHIANLKRKAEEMNHGM